MKELYISLIISSLKLIKDIKISIYTVCRKSFAEMDDFSIIIYQVTSYSEVVKAHCS